MSTSAQLIRSIFALGIAQVLTWAAGAFLTILLPKYLGDAGLGKFATAFAFVGLLGLLADLGTAAYLTKEVARNPDRAPKLTANALAVKLPLSLLAAAVVAISVNLVGYDELTRNISYVLCAGILLEAVSGVMLGSLQGLQQMKALAISSVIIKVGYSAFAAGLLILGAGAFEVAVASVSSLALGLSVNLFLLVKRVRIRASVDWVTWNAVLFGGLPFFVWQAALVVYGQIDMVLLSFLTRDVVVGWYAAAYRIVMIPVFVPTVIITAIYPALSANSKNPAAFNQIARRAVHAVMLMTIPMAIGIMLLADKMVQFFDYPAGFNNSIPLILLLAPHVPLAGVDVIIGTALATRDKQRQWAITGIVAAILNPLFNVLFIPVFQSMFGNGALAAAAITTLTEVSMLIVGLRLLPAGVFNRNTAVEAVKFLTAGLVMALAVVWTRELPLAVPIVLGGCVYAAACLALGVVSRGDLEQVRLHLVRRQTSTAST
jgi:O-antigen/teichoic acid export membrane protein